MIEKESYLPSETGDMVFYCALYYDANGEK